MPGSTCSLSSGVKLGRSHPPRTIAAAANNNPAGNRDVRIMGNSIRGTCEVLSVTREGKGFQPSNSHYAASDSAMREFFPIILILRPSSFRQRNKTGQWNSAPRRGRLREYSLTEPRAEAIHASSHNAPGRALLDSLPSLRRRAVFTADCRGHRIRPIAEANPRATGDNSEFTKSRGSDRAGATGRAGRRYRRK